DRLAGDLDEVAADLADVVDGPVGPEDIDRDRAALLADALAAAAGVPALAGAVADAHRQRGRWALDRVWGFPRRDPGAGGLARAARRAGRDRLAGGRAGARAGAAAAAGRRRAGRLADHLGTVRPDDRLPGRGGTPARRTPPALGGQPADRGIPDRAGTAGA